MIIPWASGGKIHTSAKDDSVDWHLNTKPVLLIHGNGADESQTITDSGPTGHTITANGNVQIDTAQSKFNGSSILFDGTGDYLSFADHANWNMGSGKFTIETWARFASVASAGTIFTQQQDVSNIASFTYTSSAAYFRLLSGGDSIVEFSGAWSISVNTWYHIVLIRGWGGNANSWAICLNGTAIATDTDDSAWPDYSEAFHVGMWNVSTYPFNGWMQEFRIVKGTAIWTANFTPPSKPYLSWS